MPLPEALKRLAEDEVRVWMRETGTDLSVGSIRAITVETLYRRMMEKHSAKYDGFTIDDFKDSLFEDGDYYMNHWL